MIGFWDESRWHIAGKDLVLPSGERIALKTIKNNRADQIEGRLDLVGKWSGWKVRQQFLIAPGGTMRQGRITEHVMKYLIQMTDRERIHKGRMQLELF